MTEKDSHPIRNGVIATVIGGLILAAIPYTRDIVASVSSFIWHILVSTTAVVWTYFTASVATPWFVIWLLIAFAVPTLWRIAKHYIPRHDSEPGVQDYTTDFFFSVNWKWTYQWGDNPVDITPFCPVCSTRLVLFNNVLDHNTTLHCETCNQDFVTLDGAPGFVIRGTIARQIERRINTGEWKTRVKRRVESVDR